MAKADNFFDVSQEKAIQTPVSLTAQYINPINFSIMPDLIHLAIPFFLVLLALESFVNTRRQHDWYEWKDTFSSLAMGIGNVAVGFINNGLVIGAFWLAWEYRLFDLGESPASWAALLIAEDFSYYWFHRISHETRYFWASHVVHHSSQKYNLATALRQTWTGELSGSFLFWLWLPLVGFHPFMVLTQRAISLLYQFWIHTEAIGKLPGPIEYFFNTPSHHRVHHGSDVKYLDRNHGGIFIIWDRLFGTFQAEEERPRYGLVKNIRSYNPFYIAFHEWVDLWKDFFRGRGWREKIMYIFGPPGWSPDGSKKTTKQLREQLQNNMTEPPRPPA